MKNRFIIFMQERIPIVPQILLVMGFTLSGAYLSSPDFQTAKIFFVAITTFTFLSQLRFMDEIKDYEKDKIANPTRPLPRGLLPPSDVLFLIKISYICLFSFTAFAFLIHFQAGIFLLLTITWLHLMYKEFFMGEKLSQYPLLYAITHQIIVIPLCLFIAKSFNSQVETSYALTHSLMILGAFFTYEVGRKLSPKTHPILKTYLQEYGKIKTFLLSLLLLTFSGIMAYQLDLLAIIGTSIALTLSSFIPFFLNKNNYKLTELMVSLNLMLTLWIIPIKAWL